MAKRYDNDFDAEGFVENFRAKDYPAAPSAATDGNQRKDPQTDGEATVKKEKRIKSGNRKGILTESVDDYKATFIDDLKYRFPESGWSQVKIHPELKAKIIFLETLCRSHRANLSTFINNVLEQHFRDYEAQITELKNKYNENE